MGRLYVSASEIESWELCQRRWAFLYVENRRSEPNESAALGTRVHAILEKWLKDGIAPDMFTPEGEIAASGLHLLPPPRTPTLVTEEKFYFTSKRAWFSGIKDFRYRDTEGLLHVGDHKTTKSMNWAKSLDEILCHSQALIYAVDEFHKNPNDQRLALDWIYYRTTGARKAEPRFQIVSRETVAEMFFEYVDPVAGEITQLHHEVPVGTSALDFKPDFRACDAFGGCPFLSICNPTPTQRVQANMTQAGLTLGEKLKAMKAGRPPSPIHPPEHLAPPQVPAMPAPAFFAPPGAPAAPIGVPFQLSLPTPGATPQLALVPQAAPAPLPMAGHHAPPTPVVVAAPVPQATPPAPPVPVAEAPAAPAKKRGRPKATQAAVPPEQVDAAVMPGAALQEYAVRTGFTLYVGCAPLGHGVTCALDYVDSAHEELKKLGVGHYREIEFGKGPGELCKALEEVLALCETTGNAPSGDIVLGDTQIEQDTASVWFSKAAKIVRAFR